MKYLIIALSIALSTLSFNQASAEEFIQSCGNDLQEFCSKVAPGEGRIAACLYAHSDLIEDGCVAAIEDVVLQLEWLGDRVTYALDQCEPDISKHCSSTEVGDGRIFSCLLEKKAELDNSCTKVIDNIETRLE